MTTILLALYFLLYSQVLLPNGHNCFLLSVHRMMDTQADTTLGKAWWERKFSTRGQEYIAQIISSRFNGFILWQLKGSVRIEVYRFAPGYNYTSGQNDLQVVTFNENVACIAWRWCKGHDCPERNGVLVVEPVSKNVFRLEYDDDKVFLSKNMAAQENRNIRAWILKWWAEWPGFEIGDKDIVYRSLN